MSAQVTEELGKGMSPEHRRPDAAATGPAVDADRPAHGERTRLSHPQAEVVNERLSATALQHDDAGAGCWARRLSACPAGQPQASSPRQQQQLNARPAARTEAADGGESEAARPRQLNSSVGEAVCTDSAPAQRSAVAGPAAMARSRADDGGRDDADEVLSQKPLAEIRQQMLASQPKRAQQRRDSMTPRSDQQRAEQHVHCSLQDASAGGHVQLSQVPLAVRASTQLAPPACGDQLPAHGHGHQSLAGVDVQLSQIPLAKRATGTLIAGSRQARQAQAQPQRRPGAGACGAADAAACSGASRAPRGSVRDGARGGTKGALQTQAEARTQSWSASAAHLRHPAQQQTPPPPRWSNPNDQENDPLEDMTLHQRQWFASGQHRPPGRNGSRLTGAAAPAVALKLGAEVRRPPAQHGTPGPCPDSAASELLGSAPAAAAAVVARVERQAAEAVQELERKISGIGARVLPDRVLNSAGGSAPGTEPRPAQPSPKLAALTPGGAWLPAPEPTPEPRSTPWDSQHGLRRGHDAQPGGQRPGAGGTDAADAPTTEAAQCGGTADVPTGAAGAAGGTRGCGQAVQGDRELRAKPPSMQQTPRDPASWSGVLPGWSWCCWITVSVPCSLLVTREECRDGTLP